MDSNSSPNGCKEGSHGATYYTSIQSSRSCGPPTQMIHNIVCCTNLTAHSKKRAWELFCYTQEDTMAHYTALLQEHKEEAQSGLEYYGRLRSETECNYRHICILQQQNLTPGRLAELKRVKRTFSAFISA